MMSRPRPNLFLVGSMKSGTSSLHAYLGTHPMVFMTVDPKEPTYFLRREQLLDVLPGIEKRGYWRSEERYLELFAKAGDAPVIGEASANYARLHRVTGVPQRIAKFNLDARIILIMRDPVERTISHYWYMVRFFEERRDILTAIHEEPDYTDTSYYAIQLRPYLKIFGARNVKTLTMEALRDQPRKTMADVFRWLGVDDSFVPPNFDQRINEAPSLVTQVRGFGLLHKFRHSNMWNEIGSKVPTGIRSFVRSFSERSVARKEIEMTPVKRYLRPMQCEQTQELAEILGRDFPEWTSLYTEA